MSFVNKVWKVSTSSSGAPGTLSVFLAEGTLVKVEVLTLSHNEFRIKSNNPGGPVEITFVPADDPPQPK